MQTRLRTRPKAELVATPALPREFVAAPYRSAPTRAAVVPIFRLEHVVVLGLAALSGLLVLWAHL